MNGRWIEDRLDVLRDAGHEKSKTGLARALGLDPARVTEMIAGHRNLKIAEIPASAQYLELSMEMIVGLANDMDTAELAAFPPSGTRSPEHDREGQIALLGSDTYMARVLEDLVELLSAKGLISEDDLPDEARQLITHRRQLRVVSE